MMILIGKLINESLNNNISTQISLIIDNSSITPIERIEKMIQILLKNYNLINNEKNLLNKELKDSQEKILIYKNKFENSISLFEDEIRFLQKLTSNNDLQNIIFFRENKNCSLLLDNESKEYLIKNIIKISKFIEESYQNLNKDDSCLNINGIDKIELFNLLNPIFIEEKIEKFINKISNINNFEIREIISIFAVEVLSNSILINHCSNLSNQFEFYKNKSNEEINENLNINKYKKLLNKYEKMENNIRELLSNIFENSNELSLIEMIKKTIELINLNNNNEEIINKLNLELNEINEKYNNLLIKYKEKINLIKNKFNNNINNLNNQILELNNNNLLKDNEIKQIFEEKNIEILNLTNNINNLELKINENKKNYNNELNNKNLEINNLNETLIKLISKAEKISNNRKELKNKIKILEDFNLKTINSLKEKSNNLKNQFNLNLQQLQVELNSSKSNLNQIQDENQILNIKINELISENNEINIEKKTLELKLKSINDKLELQIKNLKIFYENKINLILIENKKKF